MRKQRKLKTQKLKQQKQQKLIQHSIASPDVSWDRSRGSTSTHTSTGSEMDFYSESEDHEEQSWSDNSEENVSHEEVSSEKEEEEEEEDEEAEEVEEKLVLHTRLPVASTSKPAPSSRFRFSAVDMSDSESEEEESESSEEGSDDESNDTNVTTSSPPGTNDFTLDIEFNDDADDEDDESDPGGEESPIRKFGQVTRLSRLVKNKGSEEQQLLLLHLLYHFTSSRLGQEQNAFSDLAEQLQKIGILEQAPWISDFRQFRMKFMRTFEEQISSSLTKGEAFSTLWTAPSATPESQAPQYNSRYKTDFTELGFLGSGAFGSVIKARNNLDQRIYAVKKIYFPHRDVKEEKNILREVNLLSRVHHHNIVRYYNAWREESGEVIEAIADDDDALFDESQYSTQLNSLAAPSMTPRGTLGRKGKNSVLYIQMEYCNSTVKELIDNHAFEGSKEESWRLLRQIVTALAYLHENHIIHRDLKPSNLFIGVDRDIKVGDFGLSRKTRSQHAIARSESIANLASSDAELSTGIGTPIYTSPELLTSSTYSNKVDIYSLGIIFFEMVHPPFTTGMERLEVLKKLRETGKVPSSFPKTYEKEAQLIEWLITPDPEERPTAQELLQSEYLPVKMEEEYLRALFTQKEEDFMVGKPFDHSVAYYREKATLRFQAIFQLHCAVQFDVTPFLPNSEPVAELSLNEHMFPIVTSAGKLVNLAPDGTISLARYLSRVPETINFLKRYSFQQSFHNKRGLPVSKHMCSFDIVGSTFKLVTEVEILKVLSRIIAEFKPKRDGKFVIRINHASILQSIFDICKLDKKYHEQICKLCNKVAKGGGVAYSWNYAKNEMVHKLGINENIATKLIQFLNMRGEISLIHQNLMKLLGNSKTRESLTDVATLLSHLDIWPINNCELIFDLSCCNHIHRYDGIIIECGIRRRKRYTTVAYGGRYDRLVKQFTVYDKKPHHVVGLNIKLDKLIKETTLVEGVGPNPRAYTSSVPDVIVCSIGRNMLEERMKIIDGLWEADIKSDLMYDDRMNIEDVRDYCQQHQVKYVVITEPNLVTKEVVKVRMPDSAGTDSNKKPSSVIEVSKKDLVTFINNCMAVQSADNAASQNLHKHVSHVATTKHIEHSHLQFDPKNVTIISSDTKLKQGKQKKVITDLTIKHTVERIKKMQGEAHVVAVCMLTAEEIRTAVSYVLDASVTEIINQAIKDKSNKWKVQFNALVKHLKELKAKRSECVYLCSVDDKHKIISVSFSHHHGK
jgi:serine/threonine protein kinase